MFVVDTPGYSGQTDLCSRVERTASGRVKQAVESVCDTVASISLLFSFLVVVSTTLVAAEKPYAPETMPGTTVVSAEEVIEMILANPALIVIDSRKKTEYIKGHIEGATNILNTDLKLENLESIAPEKTTALLFYCNGIRCLRSSDSIAKAVDWGYENVFWFRGGWKEWTEKRLPVVTD